MKVVYRASWPDQEVIDGTIEDIHERVKARGITKTAMIIIGWALDDGNGAVSKLYDKGFSHEYRKSV